MIDGWRSALERWLAAGLIDTSTAEKIRSFEAERGSSSSRLPALLAWSLGGLLLASGVLLFVAAHWDRLSPVGRFTTVASMVLAAHLGAVLAARSSRTAPLGTVLHAVGTVGLGAGIFLVAQIFHLPEEWPLGTLLWAAGAWAGWLLLRQWPQALAAALLMPTWLVAEWATLPPLSTSDRPAFMFVVLLAAIYLLSRRGDEDRPWRKALAWAGGLVIIPTTGVLADWHGGHPDGWTEPMGWALALLLPVAFGTALARRFDWRHAALAMWVALLATTTLSGSPPGLKGGEGAPALVPQWWSHLGPYALCCIASLAMCAWGVQDRRPERINLGTAGFGLTILMFYFSNVFDKLGRSLALITLGLLFLALGWGLTRARRVLLDRFDASGGAV